MVHCLFFLAKQKRFLYSFLCSLFLYLLWTIGHHSYQLRNVITKPSKTLAGVDRIYVLTASNDRAEYMRRLLSVFDVDYQFFHGPTLAQPLLQDYLQKVIIWSRAQPDETWATDKPNSTIAGRIGCHLGHIAIWRDIAKDKVKSALILEDDVDIHLSFPTSLASALRNLPSNWDMLFPGYCSTSWWPNKTWGPPPDDGREIHRLSRAACGHAYILRDHTVQVLLQRSEILEPVFDIAWDGHMAHFISDSVIKLAYGMTPALIVQRPKSRHHQSLVQTRPISEEKRRRGGTKTFQ